MRRVSAITRDWMVNVSPNVSGAAVVVTRVCARAGEARAVTAVATNAVRAIAVGGRVATGPAGDEARIDIMGLLFA